MKGIVGLWEGKKMVERAYPLRSTAENCVGSAVAVHRQGRQHRRRGAEADPYGLDCSEDHGDSPVARH